MSYKFRTIEEMEAAYYGVGNVSNYLNKADAPLTTSTSGVYNPVFGAYAWANLNLEANAFGVLPKYPWLRSGFRIITAKPTLTTTNGNTTLGGTPEGGSIAETALPTLAEVSLKPKTMQLPFEVSEVMEFLATESQDDIWGGLGALRLFNAVQHKEFINRALLADVEAGAVAGGTFAGTDNFESLDRIIGSKGEADYFDTVMAGTDHVDPWKTLDRDAATTYDCYVTSPSGTIGTNGVLTDETLTKVFMNLHKNAGKYPTVILSSEEGYREIQGIYSPQVRIGQNFGEATVQVDVNGIKTFGGVGVGLHVDTVYGVPVIPTKDAPSYATDTDEIGRILFMDTSDPEGFGVPRLGIQVARPTQYFEASRFTAGYPFINDKFNEKALYRTMAQVVCRHFKSQGKIRDIKV